jgi:uncharacterized membrane protein
MTQASRLAASQPLPVRTVGLDRPLHWLRAGWRDLARTPVASLLHGAAFALGGWAMLLLSPYAWWLAPGAFSGFVLVAPILCAGLYELSRLLARGERPGIADALAAWQREARGLVGLGVLLLGLASLWVLVSGVLFWLFVKMPLANLRDLLTYIVFAQGDWLFFGWLLAGGLGGALVFAATAVSPPLLLGRRVGLRTAVLTSVRAVGENPLPMALWAAIILAAIVFCFATVMIGFLIAVPWLGHATWHAYRDLVVTDGVALRVD